MAPVWKDKAAHGQFCSMFFKRRFDKDLDQIQQTIGNDYVLFKLDAFK